MKLWENLKDLNLWNSHLSLIKPSLWIISNSMRAMKEQLKPNEIHTIMASALSGLREDPLDNEEAVLFMLTQLAFGLKILETVRCDGPKKNRKKKV